MARFAITSFVFILDCVPLPVCQIRSGKWSSKSPSITSWAALMTNWPTSESSCLSATFVFAAACFRIPKDRITPLGIVSLPMSKLINDLAV